MKTHQNTTARQEAAVEQAREAMAAPPLDLSDAGAAALASKEAHRRVAAEGTYAHGRSVFVGPRPLSVHPSEPAAQRRLRGVLSAPGSALKRGYLLVTPLELDGEEGEEEQGAGAGRRWGALLGGSGKRARPPLSDLEQERPRVVLVNRGWVPPEWRDLWPLAFGDDGATNEGELVSGAAASAAAAAAPPPPLDEAARLAAAAALREAQPRGRVRVTGVAQADETPSSFVPANGLRDRHFFSVVASEIAEACGAWSPAAGGRSGGGGGGGGGAAAVLSSSLSSSSSPSSPPPLIQVCYDDSPGGGGVLDSQGRGESPATRALPAELEAAERAAGGTAPPAGGAAAAAGARIAAASAARAAAGVSVFPLPKPASGLVRFSIMPEDHAGYAAMWGMMSAAMGYLALARRRGGGGPKRRGGG